MAGQSPRVVLIAVDASEHAQRAFDFYFENLHRPENTVLLCHTAEQLKLSALSISQPISVPHEQWEAEATKRNMEVNKLEADYITRLVEKRVKYQCKVLYEGKPGESICTLAHDERAAMIIMGTRGLGALRRTILGSVSDYVVHHATCPVIICPPVEKRKQSRTKSMTGVGGEGH